MNAINMEYINCGCGKSDDWNKVKGLNSENIRILNDIGYGTIKGTSFQEYLSSLENGYAYGVKQISYDSGDFRTKYIVAYYELPAVRS